MESHSNQDGLPRPSYVFSADPISRPSEINFDGIKLDLSREFSLVASNPGANSLGSKNYLQVCLRIRPFTQSEKEHEAEGCVQVLDSQTVLLKDPQSILGLLSEKSSGQVAQKFSFSRVFGPETSQKEFFLGCIMEPVKDLLKGHSRLIFTYGLTNSGKTYTFQGTEENIGILPRTLNVLFDSLQERLYTKMSFKPHRCREYLQLSSDQEKEESAHKNTLLRQIKEVTIHNDSYDILCGRLTNSLTIPEFEESMNSCDQSSLNVDNIKYSVWVSFFEIYNESIYDLFVPVSSKLQKRKMLRLSQDVKGYSFIKDLQWIQVSDPKEAYRLLKLGVKHQSVAFTKLNNASSRSHSIFTIRILQIEDSEIPRVTRVSELSLCDLAGSERSMKTQNEGERLREAGNINTSLLTLGKCINVLKNSEKSKFQQHVPFRESKLTHYFQSFFTGKGKICMIINISQCCSAYDETLNVLKFSTVAQKVYVPDPCSQEKSFGSVKSLQDVSLDSNLDNKILNVKRKTVSWENSLEDVAENEDLVEDLEENEETQNMETELTDEDSDKQLEECRVLTGDKKNKLLDLIENLKKRLINEKKEKLTLEFKIREEVTQEFTQYWSQREAEFKETLLHEREVLEENAERRLAIFKDLVGKCDSQDEPSNRICNLELETEEAIACLQLKFNQVKAELAETKEELIKAQEELRNRESDSLVQALKTSSKVDTSLISNKSACNEVIEMPKNSRTQTHSERKRLNEDGLQLGEPPAKKGLILVSPPITEGQNKREEMQQSVSEDAEGNRVLQEKNEELKRLLIIGENELRNEKEEKAELNKQVVSLQQQLCSFEEKNSSLRAEVEQIQASYDTAVGELHAQKAVNREQGDRILKLSQEMETAARRIKSNVSQIKRMQAKIDELRSFDSPSHMSKIDLLSLQDLSVGAKGDNVPNTSQQLPGSDLASSWLKDYPTEELSRESSFHSSIEAIWQECKEIVKASSKKSHQIQGLEEQIEKLQVEAKGYRDENSELRAQESEGKNRDQQLKEKESLIQQLREELQEKSVSLNVQVQLVAEREQVLSELSRDVTCYKAKIKDLEEIVETQKDEGKRLVELEQSILEKESAILKLEASLKEFEAKHQNHIQSTKDLNAKEVKFREEITQLVNNLHDAKQLLQSKEEENKISRRETEKLKEELAANSVLTQHIKADLQRKEEDCAELKEKFTDAKKQIEQVQREVSVMRDEEKLLRIKINELEKKKNQYSQELDMKQRTIQQLKEQLSNQKMEEAVQQYEKVCKDLGDKEKLIEGMRLTLVEQEQTQAEQDRVLEVKSEEADWLAAELDKWKEKFNDLEARSNQRLTTEPVDDIDMLNKKFSKLQDELQESEEKYKADRKKWLEEKAILTTQAKDAENLRNREMRKYAEDRERCLKLQNEVETLTAQLAEKNSELQKWREERDQLVTAVETQMKALLSSSKHKDEEIQQLRKAAAESSRTENQTMNLKPEYNDSVDLGGVETEPQSTSFEISRNTAEDGSVVLDSCEVSTENVQSTRFPKPELEIQFTPLQPNKMAVKHPGCATPVTIKIPKARKRKSGEIEEDLVKCENKKNSTPRSNVKFPVSEHRNSSAKKEQKVFLCPSSKKTYSLRSQASTVSANIASKKREGTLQKFGDFLQHSPTILQSKAKKIIETMSSPKLSTVEVSKENVSQPKKPKRKLYRNEISSPINISGQVILMEQKVKETDHQILKRRLRTRTAK
ncbi:kinesin-like protein KIF20B isoform X2 [Grammomys surdaster]|uniref:kinesin-like protein KIF20B isoform X2 n=1 Tax=Grammomys surdaster TaxID=491861 RepID=UPI0010A04942|nr:kinesin-like protein KIF20B isoform X2 [Grammomys surdaster]